MNVLLFGEEYERLTKRDQQTLMAADTPEHFLADIEMLAAITTNGLLPDPNGAGYTLRLPVGR